MAEEAPVKRKRGRPRKVVVEAEVLHARAPTRTRDPARGKHRIEPGAIVEYEYSDTKYQFKATRRVETEGAPTWIWGSTRPDGAVDMVVEESECLLIRDV